MCEQTEIPYKEGDVVWVKLGKCFWPGLVRDFDKLSEDILESFKKRPIAAVQFFEEDTYEFVKNLDQISLYNGRKKLDFIKKGLDLFRNQKEGSNFMSKFPEDVKKAELLTGGNPDILLDPQFQPKEKSSYRDLFDKSPEKIKKEKTPRPRGRPSASSNGRRSAPAIVPQTPPRPITHARFVGGETDHDVRIRQQKSTPLTSSASQKTPKPKTDSPYKCHLCDFTSNRLNVIILHNKFHSGEEATKSSKSKGKGAGKGKTSLLKTRSIPTSPAKQKTPIKTKSDEAKLVTPTSTPLPSSPKATVSPKVGNKRKFIEEYKVDLDEIPPQKAKAKDSPEKKPSKTPEKTNEKKPVILGKRKSAQSVEKTTKKNKNDAEIRDKLLADWDEEDAEKEEMELEQLKKKPSTDIGDSSQDIVITNEASCFDFDDSKDAILDSQLEERAKKFVESRKPAFLPFSREKVEITSDPARLESNLETLANVTVKSEESKVDNAANADDFDKAIDNLLAETCVPTLPQVPCTEVCKSSGILPDVVLDSSAANTTKNAVCKGVSMGAGDHDYSVKKVAVDEILDINSMQVVMTDDIMFTEEATTSHISTPDIDLISTPDTANTHNIVFTDGELKMPTSVRSAVKAVRTTTADRSKVISVKSTALGRTAPPPSLNAGKVTPANKPTLASKGIAGGKYIILQSASGQQSRLTLAPTTPPEKAVAGSSQTSGKVVILSKPQGQKSLTPGQKVLTPGQRVVTPGQMILAPGQRMVTPGQKVIGTPQRLMTSTGQILTQVNPRGGVPAGAKLTPITSQQMRTLTPGTQKITMKSSQTKVSLPSMQAVRPPNKQPVRMTNAKAVTSTIYIQAPQGGPSASKLAVSTLPKAVVPPARMVTQPRPRMLTQPKILQSRSTLQPRIISQSTRLPPTTTTATQVRTFTHLAPAKSSTVPVLQKIVSPQKKTSVAMQRMPLTQPKPLQLTPRAVPKQTIQKASIISTMPIVEPVTAQPLPPLVPLQAPVISQPEIVPSLTSSLDSTVITSDQLAHVMASTNQLDAGSGATYVLLTIDEAGNLHPYNNQSLIGYDGNDPATQTLYIDSSSLETGGDLDNMILTIDNSAMNISDSGSMYDMRLPGASQDILAAALANTDVFQPEVTLQDPMTSCVVDTSALLASIPSTLLLPSLNRVGTSAANVSETSLTLNQPIMSPLEVSSNVTSFRVPPSISSPQNSPLYDESLLRSLDIVSTAPTTSVFTSANPLLSNAEPTPPYHPSMPLLSEEAIETRIITDDLPKFSTDVEQSSIVYNQLTFQNDLVLSSTAPDIDKTNTNIILAHDTTAPIDNEDMSRYSEEYAGEIDPSDRLVIVTSSPSEVNDSAQELAIQTRAEITSLQSDLGSDILASYLSEPPTEKTQPDHIKAQSMPLLSDDLAIENSEDQEGSVCTEAERLEDPIQKSQITPAVETRNEGGER